MAKPKTERSDEKEELSREETDEFMDLFRLYRDAGSLPKASRERFRELTAKMRRLGIIR